MRISLAHVASLAAAATVALAGPAMAEWPEKQVKILVHSNAGSSTDIMARALAKGLEEVSGETVIVQARGKEAMPALLNSDADGYTLATQTRSFLPDLMSQRSPFNPDDFQWIARLVGESYAYGVLADSEFKSFADLVAKSKENPGNITMSTYKTGSMHQISALILNDAAGIDVNVIPYDSGSDLVVAMLGGNVDVAATNPSRLVQPVEAHDARALVVTAEERNPKLPDTPTALELGYDVVQAHWRGLIGKAGIPEETLQEMDAALEKAVNTEAFRDYAEKGGLELIYLGPTRLPEAVRKEMEQISPTLKRLGML